MRHVKWIQIRTLWRQGHSQRAIGKAVHCGLQTVERWVQRFRQANAQGIPEHVAVIDEPHPGADPKITIHWQGDSEVH